ncbi:MAG: PDZ domain-containing protein, partial [Planctomycetales bacterium]|nr:PDZ domain-containing protein [Planctomycetales bacterium]
MQWVLHHSDSEDEVEFVVERDGIETELTLDLPEGWKQAGDISWRVSTWNLRRMVTGGLVLKTAEDSVRRQNRVDPDSMAIVVEYVGQYGQHAAGKNAGFQKGDLIVAFDGRKDLLRETDLISYALRELAGEERVSVTIMRDGREMELELPLQR